MVVNSATVRVNSSCHKSVSTMVEACLRQCSNLLLGLREAGVLQSYRLEYELSNQEPHPLNIASVKTTVQELIRSLQEFKDKLSGASKAASSIVDPKIVQIQVDRKVIDDRIEAFITRKRKEVDEWNVQEFCSSSKAAEADGEPECSCARVDAVFVPRSGGSSHVKVSRVVNQWGPMTKLMRPTYNPSGPSSPKKEEPSTRIPEGVEERLRNMESHLKLKSGCSVPQDVYTRIKELEDRILYLEGISPDYFVSSAQNVGIAEAKNATEATRQFDDWSMSEIESRISQLQSHLRERSDGLSKPSTSSMTL